MVVATRVAEVADADDLVVEAVVVVQLGVQPLLIARRLLLLPPILRVLLLHLLPANPQINKAQLPILNLPIGILLSALVLTLTEMKLHRTKMMPLVLMLPGPM
jgi:hypothetical protein